MTIITAYKTKNEPIKLNLIFERGVVNRVHKKSIDIKLSGGSSVCMHLYEYTSPKPEEIKKGSAVEVLTDQDGRCYGTRLMHGTVIGKVITNSFNSISERYGIDFPENAEDILYARE